MDLLVFLRFLRLLLVCSCFYVKPGPNFRIFISVHSLVHVHFHNFSYFSKLLMLESLSLAFFFQAQYILFKMHTRWFKCKPGRCSADSSFCFFFNWHIVDLQCCVRISTFWERLCREKWTKSLTLEENVHIQSWHLYEPKLFNLSTSHTSHM